MLEKLFAFIGTIGEIATFFGRIISAPTTRFDNLCDIPALRVTLIDLHIRENLCI